MEFNWTLYDAGSGGVLGFCNGTKLDAVSARQALQAEGFDDADVRDFMPGDVTAFHLYNPLTKVRLF